jgi:uncharacterized protein
MLAAWLLAAPLFASVPEIDRPVVDVAGVLDAAQEEVVAERLVRHRDATGVQMAVLVVRSTAPLEIADYAQTVFEAWGGGSAERDDGALFVLAIDDRRNRLHLGYGLEPLVSDATAQGMLEDLRPSLQSGAYGDAVQEIVDGVVARTAHVRPGETIGTLSGDSPWWWVVVALLGLGVGVAWGTALGRVARKGRWRASRMRRFGRMRALAADRAVQGLTAGIALAQIAIAIAFGDGVGYVAAYSLVAWIHFALGWLSGATTRRFGWTFAVIVAVVLVAVLALQVGPRDRVGASDIAAFSAMLAFMTFLFGGLTALCVWAYKVGSGTAHAGGSSYGGHTSSSHSTSSSAPSSSTDYGSTSYASSTYTGGGGSSGGGGASSSW